MFWTWQKVVAFFFIRRRLSLRLAILAIVAAGGAMGVGAFVPTVAAAPLRPPLLQVEEREGRLYAGKGYLEVRNGVKFAHFRGSPHEIGQQHALLVVKPQLARMQAAFQRLDPTRETKNLPAKMVNLGKNFYVQCQFLPMWRRYVPREYQEEMQGFIEAVSDGASHESNEIMLANAFQDLLLKFGCSFFVATGPASRDGKMYIGRNLDHAGMRDLAALQFVAVYEPDQGYPFIVLSYPSFNGVMQGMNSEGLVVAFTYSTAAAAETTIAGLPFTLMLRKVLQYAGNLEEALAVIKRTPRTVGLNLLVADGKTGKAAVVEVSANKIVTRTMEPDGFLFAANRYLTPAMQAVQQAGWMSSALREARLAELGQEYAGRIGPREAAAIMRDKFAPGSPAHDGFFPGINNTGTMATVVFCPTDRQLWVAKAPAADDSHNSEGLAFVSIPDQEFVGFDLNRELGQPVSAPLAEIPATSSTPYFTDWLTVRRAESLLYAGRYGEAVPLLEEGLARHPRAETILFRLGEAYIKSGRTAEGVKFLEDFLAQPRFVEPHFALEAHYWLGVIADLRGEREKARAHYRAGLALEVADNPPDGDYFSRACAAGLQVPARNRKGRVVFPGADPTAQPGGKPAAGSQGATRVAIIKEIFIIGPTFTDQELIRAQLPFRVGDLWDEGKARLGEERLKLLNIFDPYLQPPRIVATPFADGENGRSSVDYEAVSVVVRVNETSRFWRDPLELGITTLVDLAGGRLCPTFYNLGGRGLNLSPGLGWGDSPFVYLQGTLPLRFGSGGIGSFTYLQSVSQKRWKTGSYAGNTYRQDYRGVELGLTSLVTSACRLQLHLGYSRWSFRETNLLGGLTLDPEAFFLVGGSVRFPAGLETPGLALTLTGEGGLAAANSFVREEATLEWRGGRGSWSTYLCLGGGAASAGTPVQYLFSLGGFNDPPLRGAASRLYGDRYLAASLELRRRVRSGLALFAFTDVGSTWVGWALAPVPAPLTTLGGGLRFQPPMGPPVEFTLGYSPREKHLGWAINFLF